MTPTTELMRSSGVGFRSGRTLCSMEDSPVEYKGGSIPPPDQRRSYN